MLFWFMDKDQEFIDRIRKAVDSVGGQAAMAEATNLSKSVISKYVNGHSEPDRKRLVAIANAANVPVGWLVNGENPALHEQIRAMRNSAMKGTWPANIEDHTDEGDLVTIPFYKNSIASSDDASKPISERLIYRDIPYPASRYFIHKVLGVNSIDDLGVFIVHGDCMEPTMYSGNVVIVDLTEVDLIDGIHLIVDRGGIHYRRLHIPHGGKVELRYDNANMYPENVKIEDEELPNLEIVGRVIWHGHRM